MQNDWTSEVFNRSRSKQQTCTSSVFFQLILYFTSSYSNTGLKGWEQTLPDLSSDWMSGDRSSEGIGQTTRGHHGGIIHRCVVVRPG